MASKYIVDQEIKHINFAETGVEQADYENCTFNSCIFSNCDISDLGFEDCEFIDCDFSNTKITNTAFKNIRFINCKLIGVQFDECNPFLLEFSFEKCILNYSSFYQLKIKGTRFTTCTLLEVDFTETDLSGANFTECDFSGSMFGNTNLKKTDLRGSTNFSINPGQNQVAGAKFSLETLPGLLQQYNIIVE